MRESQAERCGERREGWTYASNLPEEGTHVVLVVFFEDVGRLLVLERGDLLARRACKQEPDVGMAAVIPHPRVER